MPFDFGGRGAGNSRGAALKNAIRRASALLSALIISLSAVGCKPPDPPVPDNSLPTPPPRSESAEYRTSESTLPPLAADETGEYISAESVGSTDSTESIITGETTETAATDTSGQPGSEQTSDPESADPETEAPSQSEQAHGESAEAPPVSNPTTGTTTTKSTTTTTATKVTTGKKPTTTTSKPVTTTTAKKPDKPPAPVVIPDIKLPSSPGTLVFWGDNAVVDYSNAYLGYISACYTGSASRAKLQLIFGDATYNYDLSVGGVTEYFPLPRQTGNCLVRVCENIKDNKYALAAEGTFDVNVTDETAAYMVPNIYVDYTRDSASVKKAAELCAGLDTTIDRLAAIFGWITENITYDNDLASAVRNGSVTEYIPDPDSVLAKKKGICFDYSSLMAAMARSQGIPTRVVVGYASPDIYHAWNEVYTEETGWITPALLLKKHGFNIVDATFYAGSENKEAVSEYISDSGNYSSMIYY